MKKARRSILVILGSVLIFLATGCKSKAPETKYGVIYETKYGVQPAEYDSTIIINNEKDI